MGSIVLVPVRITDLRAGDAVQQLHAGRFAFALLLCCVSSEAGFAQPAVPANPASAEYETALTQALEAHARGDDEHARTFMERAYELQPSARTLRGLGTIALAQGRILEAIRYLERALRSQVLPLTDELRASVESLVRHAWNQVGRYELLTTPQDAAWSIDGAAPDFYAPHTVVLSPGPHVLSVRARGYIGQEISLDVKPAGRQTLRRVLSAERSPEVSTTSRVVPTIVASAPRTEARSQAELRSKPSFYTPTVRWIGLGTGAALLLGGAVVWTLGYLELQGIDDECRKRTPSGCPPAEAKRLSACTSELDSELTHHRRRASPRRAPNA